MPVAATGASLIRKLLPISDSVHRLGELALPISQLVAPVTLQSLV
jgi:hypothetical protein